MYKEHVKILACPKCKGNLELFGEGEFVENGSLECKKCNVSYEILNGIPRFVESSNYADSFGFEWNMHKKTQYDSASGVSASRTRFYKETRWEKCEGKIILEAGCGSGRFTPYALELAGDSGLVISFDYSNAVDAASNKPSKNLLRIQADIFNLPLRDESCDKCFCFGVLQHTPSAKNAIKSLVNSLRGGGNLYVIIIHLTKILHLIQNTMCVLLQNGFRIGRCITLARGM